MRWGRSKSAKLVAAFAAAGLVLTPALAAGETKKRPPSVSLSFDPVATFTPANADPRLAAASQGAARDQRFQIHTAAAKGRHRKGVAIRVGQMRRARESRCGHSDFGQLRTPAI